MKQNIQGLWLLIPGLFLAAAATVLVLFPGNAETVTELTHEIRGVNTPAVTARLVEIRITRLDNLVPAAETPAGPLTRVEIPEEDIAPFYFQQPAVPQVPEPVTLVAAENEPYRLELTAERPARAALVH